DRVTLREVLDRAADQVGARFRNQPLLEAALRTTIGETYLSLGVPDKSRLQYAAALAIYQREGGPETAETTKAMIELGHALVDEGRFAEAEPLLLKALDGSRRALGEEHDLTLRAMTNLAELNQGQGKSALAEELFAKVLNGSRRVRGEEHRETLQAMNDL